jgi:hypothetical protein
MRIFIEILRNFHDIYLLLNQLIKVFARVLNGGDFNQVIGNILYSPKLLPKAFLKDI